MEEFLLFLNQPLVLVILFVGAIVLVLIDYLFPVDWPAYVGYVLFALFIGATAPVSPLLSLLAMVAVVSLMLTLHKAIFSKYLTNAPVHERRRELAAQTADAGAADTADAAVGTAGPTSGTEAGE